MVLHMAFGSLLLHCICRELLLRERMAYIHTYAFSDGALAVLIEEIGKS